MHAIVLVRHGSAQRAFAFQEMPDPHPGYGEVRIAVEMSGVNFADLLARKGLYKEAPPLPCILGYDVVGYIDEVGNGVTSLRTGMRVVAMTRFGGYAEKVIARTFGVVRLPENFDSASATALGTQCTTAWFCAMEMVRLRSGDRVIVHAAAGGVGTALVQLAKWCDCVVFGTTGSISKIDYLKSIGVDYPICTATNEFDRAFLHYSNGKGADVIFDSLGGSCVQKGLRLLAPGGSIVCYGVSDMCSRSLQLPRCIRTLVSFGLVYPVGLLLESRGIIGVNLLRIADERPEIIQRCMHSVADLAQRGRLKPVASKVMSHLDVAPAHELMESRQSVGKIALRWSSTTQSRRQNAAAELLTTSQTYSPMCEP